MTSCYINPTDNILQNKDTDCILKRYWFGF